MASLDLDTIHKMEGIQEMDENPQKEVSVHWFRHGLRLHDNPALFEASRNSILYPIFIFDGETAGLFPIYVFVLGSVYYLFP